jgi:DNA-binding response OmpR family regulator
LNVVSGQVQTDPKPQRRILVAEDDEAIAKMLLKVLGQRYAVDLAKDGEAALAMARKTAPNLFIFDVMMPKIDGLQVARRVREVPSLRVVPIIFLTGRTRPADVVQGIQAGARHYLTKPFKVDELLSKVTKILGE